MHNIMSPFLLLLLLCLSMYACNARSLGLLIDKEARKQVFTKDLEQDVDKMNLEQSLISWETMTSLSEEFGAQAQNEVGNDHRSTHEIFLGASTMKYKYLTGFMKEKDDNKRDTSGHKDIVSSQNDLQQESKIQGLKRQGRKILGLSSHVTEESTVESKENNISEDIVVTDYAQPHRKPPIHNEKP